MLAQRLTEAANLVRQSVMKQNQKSKRRWDAHIRPRSFSPGDRVWVFMPDLLKVKSNVRRLPNQPKPLAIRRTKKLAFRWRGPCRIIEKEANPFT